MMPPLITVGSTPPLSSSAAIIEVVVVLPCVPATATVFCIRISSASISARSTRGRRRSAAASISGIAVLDRGRADDHRGVAEIVGGVADADRNAGLAQLFDDIAFGDVGALHLVAELVHDLGDAGHADAADADEVDRADVGAHCLHHAGIAPPARRALTRAESAPGRRRPAQAPSPTRSTRSARSRAACGRPTDRARAAALLSATGSAAIASIWRASTSGVKLRLLDRPRAAGLDHFARVGGLVIVGRRGERDQDRGAPGGGQLGDGRSAGAADHQMRVGELVRHVLDIGHQLGGDAERRHIALADPLDVVGPALLDDLQPAPKRRLEHAEPLGHDLAQDGRALAPPVTRIFSGAISSNGGNGSSPSRAISSRTGLPTSTVLPRSAASAGRPGRKRCRSPRPRRRAGG